LQGQNLPQNFILLLYLTVTVICPVLKIQGYTVITLEKLLLLKSITLFKQMPEDLLLHLVTSLIKEKMVSAEELILDKSDVNSIIYIIVSGTVKVHDESRTIKELGAREIFGELSALTNQKPVCNVSALEDCLLLTIDGDSLYDLMSIEPGLSKGIIIALCERTQGMSKQIQELLNEP
jgi:CRP-like cAMP-binding protein